MITLLIIAKEVSNIGNARTNKGAIIIIAVYVFATPSIEITESTKPIKFEPVSPINVLAGLKLKGKKPRSEPARAVARIIEITGDEFNININIKQIAEINETPDERPSNPSNKFIAFVIPTIQNTVNIFKNISLEINELGDVGNILSITMPLATTTVAAIICPINFIIGLIPLVSSK